MPRFDGTGPGGYGPGTGRGIGPCGAGTGFRRGSGRGLGRGFGRRGFWGYQPYQPQITKTEEKEILAEDMADLKEELKAIEARLAKLKGKK